jgi:hypothetical protein
MSKKIERISSSLQVDEDIDLQIKGWIVQRIGWILMLAFLISAALGLFGDGVLSQKELASNGTTVMFEKFLRRECDTEMEIIANGRDGKIEVTLAPGFTEIYKIDRILPAPSGERIDHSSTVIEFSAEGQAHIVFFLKTRERVTGRVRNILAVNDTKFEMSHYIYP